MLIRRLVDYVLSLLHPQVVQGHFVMLNLGGRPTQPCDKSYVEVFGVKRQWEQCLMEAWRQRQEYEVDLVALLESYKV